jgi:hypothetical protein
VVERTHLRLPLDPLLGRQLLGTGRLEILVRDAIDEVQLGPTPDEQDLGQFSFLVARPVVATVYLGRSQRHILDTQKRAEF